MPARREKARLPPGSPCRRSHAWRTRFLEEALGSTIDFRKPIDEAYAAAIFPGSRGGIRPGHVGPVGKHIHPLRVLAEAIVDVDAIKSRRVQEVPMGRAGMSIRASSVLCVTTALLIGGCGSDSMETPGIDGGNGQPDSGPGGDAGAKGPAWTVFVYGNGDNNLANGLVADLTEMSNATIAANVQIVVLADFDASEMDATGNKFSVGYGLLRVVGGGKDFEMIEEGAEISLTDPKTLQGMVKKVFEKFPAQHHGIIMWDHGGSWGGGFGPDEQDGTDKTGKTLSMTEIVGAVKQGLTDAGLTAERPPDFFGLDTCLVGAAETAPQ